MERPFAYVCSPFRGDVKNNTRRAQEYCRQVYEAGYIPLAPHLLFPQFLDDNDPAQRQAGIDMGLDLLTKCNLLVVCGADITEGIKQLMAGGGIVVIGITLIPLLSGLFS